MQFSIRRAIAAFTAGEDAQRHFDLAAERIQHALLDVAIPEIPGVDIGVHAEPARLVGGDYIDIFRPTNSSFVFGLGDASGKSLAAALNALMLRYLVRGLTQALGTADLAAIMSHMNAVVADDMTEGSFITFLLGTIDVTSGSLRIVNAGHEPPLLLKPESDTVETIDEHGLVLGIQRTAMYAEAQRALYPGEIVLFYTDGLTEATNDRGELYTLARLKDTLLASRTLAAQALADVVFDAVKRYSTAELRDDATILVLRLGDR